MGVFFVSTDRSTDRPTRPTTVTRARARRERLARRRRDGRVFPRLLVSTHTLDRHRVRRERRSNAPSRPSIIIMPEKSAAAASTTRRRAREDEDETTDERESRKKIRTRGVKNPRLIGRKFTGGANASLFIRQWAWKREMKTERERFEDAYAYPTREDEEEEEDEEETGTERKRKRAIVLKQKKFAATGFASTVWDSAVVLSKYAEKTRRDFARAKTCVELGAGCGLISAVMAEIVEVPRVIATDVEGNMELLRENVEKYGVETRAVTWGADAEEAFADVDVDVVVASDVVYWNDSMDDLVMTLRALAKTPKTRVLMAYGRNRQALEKFLDVSREDFETRDVPRSECDALYQCTDVDVIELRRK